MMMTKKLEREKVKEKPKHLGCEHVSGFVVTLP